MQTFSFMLSIPQNRKFYAAKSIQIISRQSQIHVYDLVTRKKLLEKFNISLPTENFLEVLETFPFLMKDTMNENIILWQNLFIVKMAKVLTYWGFCSTFNLASFEEIFNRNE